MRGPSRLGPKSNGSIVAAAIVPSPAVAASTATRSAVDSVANPRRGRWSLAWLSPRATASRNRVATGAGDGNGAPPRPRASNSWRKRAADHVLALDLERRIGCGAGDDAAEGRELVSHRARRREHTGRDQCLCRQPHRPGLELAGALAMLVIGVEQRAGRRGRHDLDPQVPDVAHAIGL